MDLLFHTTATMATIKSMVVTETTAAIMPIFPLKWKKKPISMAKLKKIMKVYQSTSESLKIVLQIKRYIILTCKLLEKKNVLKPHCIKCHEFVIICEHMVLRWVWFIRCCLFCWCRGYCSNSICSAGCCWVYRIPQGNELITVGVCKLSIKKSVDWFDFLN